MSKRWMVVAAIGVVGIALAGGLYVLHAQSPDAGARREGGRRAGSREMRLTRAVPVRAAVAHPGSMDVTVNAIGTVTSRNTVVVRSRVDGLLTRVDFREGQRVKAGTVLAEIDARPFQIALEQAQGQIARDQAQLANAKADLARYQGLLKEDSIARQQVDGQAALVRQLEGTITADRAQVDSAKLQLGFTRITAPISGRLGLRLVDAGNMIHTTDPNGLVVITQTQPIAVVFSIPAEWLSRLLPRWRNGAVLPVEVYGPDDKVKLASGRLVSIDNQIDVATGTVKLKAEFANADDALFPNQFVNAHLRIQTLTDATLVPTAAIQRGAPGTFVYLIDANGTVSVHPVQLGPSSHDEVAIRQGLKPGERVVIDGADSLREGAKVEVVNDTARAKSPRGSPGSDAANASGRWQRS